MESASAAANHPRQGHVRAAAAQTGAELVSAVAGVVPTDKPADLADVSVKPPKPHVPKGVGAA